MCSTYNHALFSVLEHFRPSHTISTQVPNLCPLQILETGHLVWHHGQYNHQQLYPRPGSMTVRALTDSTEYSLSKLHAMALSIVLNWVDTVWAISVPLPPWWCPSPWLCPLPFYPRGWGRGCPSSSCVFVLDGCDPWYQEHVFLGSQSFIALCLPDHCHSHSLRVLIAPPCCHRDQLCLFPSKCAQRDDPIVITKLHPCWLRQHGQCHVNLSSHYFTSVRKHWW